MFSFNRVFNLKRIIATIILATFVACGVQASEEVSAMLKQADEFRLGQESAKVVSLVSLYKSGELDKTHQYHVYTRPNRESLVVFKSQVEAGQKMLMLGDNYWLVMPKSRRPIRITPMQKLLGEASVGDISTLTWSEDYQGKLVGQEIIHPNGGDSVESIKLNLDSVTKGASYHKIELWLSPNNYFPIKANLYLRSGKLAKQAWFGKGERNGQLAVTAMTLLDKIQPTKKTVIEYQSITEMSLADKYYNPAFLVRNSVSEL